MNRDYFLPVLLLCALGSAGCEDSASTTAADKGSGRQDLGSNGATDGSPLAPRLKLDNALGLSYIMEHPFANEGQGLTGLIAVQDQEGNNLQDATVTINGVAIGLDGLITDFYNPVTATETIPDLGPGQTITIKATRGQDTAELSFACPEEVAITSPLPGAAFAEGGAVAMSWSGRLDYSHQGLNAWAGLGSYDEATNHGNLPLPMHEGQYQQLEPDDTSATLVAELLGGGDTHFVLNLVVPGDVDFAAESIGYCFLWRRLVLEVE